MKKRFINFIKFSQVLLALVPMTALAQATTSGLTGVLTTIGDLFNRILPLIISFAVIYFIYGVIVYFIAGDEESKTAGRDKIIYGIIGLAVIVGVWGLVNIVTRTFDLGGSAPGVSNLVTTLSCPNLNKSDVNFANLSDYITCTIGKSIIPLLFSLAVVAFAWGAVKFFILESDEEAKRDQGKQFMLWGIIALAVMLSVWGLVNILGSTFGIKNLNVLPQVKPSSP